MTGADSARKVTVLGDGGWGTSLALVLARTGVETTIWGAFPEYVDEVRRTRMNRKFLDGIEIPQSITLQADAGKATEGAEMIVVAIPTKHLRPTLERIAPGLPRGVPYVSVAKGLEAGRLKRGTEIVSECLPGATVGGLYGPSHAEEVARELPTAVVAVAEDEALARRIQATFFAPGFRVYTSTDLVGVEIAGALKNVIALAAGISDGIGLGDNSKAALVTRGLAEITRLGLALGAQEATFIGLAGVGDLVTTCYSPYGRNREVGLRIGKGTQIDEIERSTEMVAEGVSTAPAVRDLAAKLGVDMPIVAEVCEVLFNRKDPRQAVYDLMNRPPKAEGEGL